MAEKLFKRVAKKLKLKAYWRTMMNFIDNKILNITGLACNIWHDLEADNLRKRLESKVENKELLPEEWKVIFYSVHELYNQVDKEYREAIELELTLNKHLLL